MANQEFDRLQKCYEAGCTAFYRHAEFNTCPHPVGSPERKKWESGWNDSEAEETGIGD